jgi:hypothetical protein
MLIALLFFLCPLSSLAGFILKKRGVRTAYIWMLLVFTSLIQWLLLLVIPQNNFSPLIFSDWFRFGDTNISLRFALNPQNWILGISFFTFNLSFFLTGIARLDIRTDLNIWIFQLMLTAFSFLAVISADLWTVVLLWTALDLLEFAFHKIILKDVGEKTYFRKLVVRFLGIMLLIWNIAFLSRSGFNSLLSGIVSSTTVTTIFLAALMHSGIFPLNEEINNQSEEKSEKLLRSAFNVSTFVVSFSLVINLPVPDLPYLFSLILSSFSYFVVVLSLIKWVLNKNLEDSIKFLLLGNAGEFIFLYLSGATQYLTYLLAVLILSVLWLILFSHRGKNLMVFAIISTFFASGLPLAINAFGPRGFIGNELSVGFVVMIFSQVLLLIGYLRYAFEKNEKFIDLEVWYQAAYLVGLFLPFISAAAITFYTRNTLATEFQYWWIGLIVVMLALIGYFLLEKTKSSGKIPQFLTLARFDRLWRLMTFDWVFSSLSFIEDKGRGLINGFSGILEGEGGILWALLLLLLIFTVIR